MNKTYSMNNEYQITENGTHYHKATPVKVVNVLECCRYEGIRIELDYGNVKTGKSWGDIYDIKGTLSLSGGMQKVPILMNNKRSTGGRGILDHCIIAIKRTDNKEFLYKHETYQTYRE